MAKIQFLYLIQENTRSLLACQNKKLCLKKDKVLF